MMFDPGSRRLRPLFSLAVLLQALCFSGSLLAQCTAPIAQQPAQVYADSARLVWLPNNNESPLLYDLEVRLNAIPFSGNPTIFSIPEAQFGITGLNPGAAYHYRVRTRCPNGNTSTWSNTQVFYTHMLNPSPCAMALPLQFSGTDCQATNRYYIDVPTAAGNSLGTNIFLKEVRLIVRHSFPADLILSLVSPGGDTVLLSSNNGATVDHIGDPSSNCTVYASFSDQACQEVTESNIQLRGGLKPEEPLAGFHTGKSPTGTWTLLACDDQIEDNGFLEYVQLVFDTQLDLAPVNICVTDAGPNSVRLKYDFNSSCQVLALQYGTTLPSQTFFIPCFLDEMVLPGLEPGKNYVAQFRVTPGGGRPDVYSCPLSFTTTCSPVSQRSTFDTLGACFANCGKKCPMSGPWINSPANISDWQVSPSNTILVNRATFRDVSGCGNFLALQKVAGCLQPKDASIESSCLEMAVPGIACGFRFSYFAAGRRDKSLLVQISYDNGGTWQTLQTISTRSTPDWVTREIDLSTALPGVFRLRIRGAIPEGNDEFLALDELLVMNAVQPVDGLVYYRDADGDSFGNPNDSIVLCSATLPAGFSLNALDCNDQDGNSYPGASEIKCNLQDENCNGMLDDLEGGLSYTFLEVEQLTCLGTEDGKISIAVFNAQGPIHLLWSNGDTTNTITGLSPGVYTCTISDDVCQIITQPILITGQPGFSVSLVPHDAFCEGNPSGWITSSLSGVVEPYGFYWNNGSQSANPEDLVPGVYVATVIDIRGCRVQTDSVIVGFVPNFSITATITPASCGGSNDGQILLEGVESGATVQWSNGSTGIQIQNLIAGPYKATISNLSGCVKIDSFVVPQPDPLSLVVTNILPVSCAGLADGMLSTLVQGGTPPYTFKWSNGATTPGLVQVPGDTYRVTVSDSKGCFRVFQNLVIPEPPAISIEIDTVIPNTCLLGNRGAIGLALSGGSGVFQVDWSNGEQEAYIDSLASGYYSVIVSDDLGCKMSLSNIEVPALNIPLQFELLSKTDEPCFGDSKGKIVVDVPDGAIPITFLWSNGAKNINQSTSDSLSNLPKGKYTVTATDINGCVTDSDTIEIGQPASAVYFTDLVIDSTNCSYTGDGSISMTIAGGTPGYTYLWSDNSTASKLTNVPAGSYHLTVTDSKGCKIFLGPWKVSAPAPITFNATITKPDQGMTNGSVVLIPSGGVGSQDVEWSTGATTSALFNLGPGSYCVTLTDFYECTNDTCILIDFKSGIHEPAWAQQVMLYPNPASQVLNISWPQEYTFSSVRLTDILGKTVAVESVLKAPGELRLSWNTVLSGWYFVELQVREGYPPIRKKLLIIQ